MCQSGKRWTRRHFSLVKLHNRSRLALFSSFFPDSFLSLHQRIFIFYFADTPNRLFFGTHYHIHQSPNSPFFTSVWREESKEVERRCRRKKERMGWMRGQSRRKRIDIKAVNNFFFLFFNPLFSSIERDNASTIRFLGRWRCCPALCYGRYCPVRPSAAIRIILLERGKEKISSLYSPVSGQGKKGTWKMATFSSRS